MAGTHRACEQVAKTDKRGLMMIHAEEPHVRRMLGQRLKAAGRDDCFVAPEVAAERFECLTVVVERSALARHRARVGRTEEVLVEGPSKKDASVISGRTRQNKLVHFATDPPLGAGTFADVRVTGAAPHHLTGQLLEVTARPRHRTRIPVMAS